MFGIRVYAVSDINLLYAPLTIPLVYCHINSFRDEYSVWRGHRQEAKRGQPCGHRVQRTCGALGSFFLTCSTTWLSLIAVWFVLGATHWGQPWTPALTLPHVRDGLSVLLMAVFCTFRRPSMCRPVHRQFMRNEWLDLTTIVPATACHQRNYVETYSRYRPNPCVGGCAPRWLGALLHSFR
jgi:hypothetical protein